MFRCAYAEKRVARVIGNGLALSPRERACNGPYVLGGFAFEPPFLCILSIFKGAAESQAQVIARPLLEGGN